MKKASKLIASLSMSLLTIGAFAQVPVKSVVKGHSMIAKGKMTELPVLHSHKAIKHNLSSLNTFEVNYSATDGNCQGANYYYWDPPAIMNAGYTAADTGAGTNKNYSVLHSNSVAFDTIEDANDFGYSAMPGSVYIDTIFASLGYHNTSGLNDTLFFIVANVSNAGYPLWTTTYSEDTVIVAPHSTALPGNVLDSLYSIYIVPNNGLGTTIPSTASHGSHYVVTVAAGNNSKLDSLGVYYGSEGAVCGGYAYDTAITCAGIPLGPLPHFNSLETGLQFYNTAAFGGNGTVLTWPLADGYIGNSAYTFGDFWALTTCSTDTAYLYFQDNFIWVTITYNDITSTNNVYSNDFDVNQNYPNPFNKTTQITYNLVKSSDVAFTVCDMTGRELTNNVYNSVAPGSHVINLSANTFAPGVYFYTLKVNGNQVTKKMVITE